jgi:hypothetical protein
MCMQLPCGWLRKTCDFSCILTLLFCTGIAGCRGSVSASRRHCRHSFIVSGVLVTVRGQCSRTSSRGGQIDFANSCERRLGRAQTIVRACGTRSLIACVQDVCYAHLLSAGPPASTVSTSSFDCSLGISGTSCRWCPRVLVRPVPYCMYFTVLLSRCSRAVVAHYRRSDYPSVPRLLPCRYLHVPARQQPHPHSTYRCSVPTVMIAKFFPNASLFSSP